MGGFLKNESKGRGGSEEREGETEEEGNEWVEIIRQRLKAGGN